MKAVILAAGEGKRLRPFTETMPKVMLPVANKPIIEHILDAIKKTGIEEIIIIVGYKKEVIMEYFKDYNDIKLTFVEQEKQLGTAHALLQAKKHIKNTFLVLSGDNIIDHNSIAKIIQEKSDYSILIKENPQPSKYGVVTIEKNILKEIREKPKEELGQFISTGIYKLPKTTFKTIQEHTSQGNYALSDIIQSIVKQEKQIKTIKAETWMDIVYPWDLIKINETMMRQIKLSTAGTIEKGVTIKGKVTIGKNTNIHSGSYIVGPVIIGEGCEIGPYACIFPSTTIGNNSVIHPFTEISNSVIMKDTHIGSNSFITNSIISKGVIIGHNFSNRKGDVTIEIEEEVKKIKNLGIMIGEDTTIENHIAIDPGVIIGRKCKIAPLKRIRENIPSGSRVM